NRPGRYTNNELNAAHKPWNTVAVRVCLAFPDLYEIGMSGLGLAILYRLVNRLPFALADRSFCPDVDLEAALRGKGVPLWGWETKKPIRDFDVLGISLQTELSYTNVLNFLNLSNVPIRSTDRKEEDPLVIAGGTCCANPMPMSPFFDAFVIGDGEEAIVDICDALKNMKLETRNSKIRRIAGIPGVFVPSIHDPNKDRIKARHIAALSYEDAPNPPLVPLVETTHDRLTIEIARGCARGCRFCQAGMTCRPLRNRPKPDILRLAQDGIAASGWDEIGLLSLSSCDYPGILELVTELNEQFADQRVSVSMPSLRLDSFSDEMAAALKKINKSGLTFAPEAGSRRLRDVINKGMSDERLLDVLRLAKRHGWNQVKLYFMIGLPTETTEDLDALAGLCHKAAGMGVNIKAALSPFVPKAHTPFQWEAQDEPITSKAKIGQLTKKACGHRIQLKWHDPEMSALEGVLARGDAKIAEAIEKAWELGCRFDQWSEHFDWAKWQTSFVASGIDYNQYLQARRIEDALPWEFVDVGINREFLLREREKAYREEATADCRTDRCQACGHDCQQKGERHNEAQSRGADAPRDTPTSEAKNKAFLSASLVPPLIGGMYGRSKKKGPVAAQIAKTKFRVRYAKGPEVRFISHLDMMRLWQRAIRRSGLPIAYSQGFSPHQKISFGPPLSLGFVSSAEYLDLQLEKPVSDDIAAILNPHLAPGVRVLDSKPIFKNTDSIVQLSNVAEYRVRPDGLGIDNGRVLQAYQDRMNANEPWPLTITRKEKTLSVDIKKQLRDLAQDGPELLIKMILVEGGAKFQDIAVAILGIDQAATARLEIERTNIFHLQDQRLVSLLDRSLL
ncbi:MAG: TIGR03960 family B12-binding radical SAM protein, partial [Candidatus Edwardsbacteria bacterium]|nr:TIGR03960 family B12-binding radical SAM protein [Candidatus Edwardsbacteria bacterium]